MLRTRNSILTGEEKVTYTRFWFLVSRFSLGGGGEELMNLGTNELRNGLPNPTRRFPDHGLPDLAGVGFLEFGHVGDYAVHAVVAGGVRVDLCAQSRGFRRYVLAPNLAPSEEETLFGRESVDLGLRLALQCIHQSHEPEAQAAVVHRVLSDRQLAVQVHVFNGSERRIFLDEALRAFFELFGIFRGPPVAHVALQIELAPAIVEAVR